MARLTFPDEGSRLVYRAAGAALGKASGASAVVYSDEAGTTLADIQTTGGQGISGAVITTDEYSRLPLFLGPDGADIVYVSVSGGPVSPVYGRNDDRLDTKVGKGELVFNVKDYGAIGDGVADDTAAIQDALDNADGTLYFPPGTYKVTGTGAAALTLTRNVTLVGSDSRVTTISGVGLGTTTDVLSVAITENSGATEVRNWRLTGLSIFANSGGRHALYFAPYHDAFWIYTSEITNNSFRGNGTNGGYSIYLDENVTHCEFSRNTLQSSVYAKCFDANVFRKNLSFGPLVAFTFDVEYGVHNLTVEDNTIVNRDGAVHVINGDTVRIVNNQIELSPSFGPDNLGATSAMIWVEGRDRVSYNTVIEQNNLGGGTGVDHLIYIDNAQKSVITANQFVSCEVAEVYFTANAKHNVLRRDNYTRGTPSNPRTRTAFKEDVVDLGVGNMGAERALSLVAPVTGGGCFKDGAGVVHFTAPFNNVPTEANTVLGYLPEGFRPRTDVHVAVTTALGLSQVLIAASDGSITAVSALPSGTAVMPMCFLATTDAP